VDPFIIGGYQALRRNVLLRLKTNYYTAAKAAAARYCKIGCRKYKGLLQQEARTTTKRLSCRRRQTQARVDFRAGKLFLSFPELCEMSKILS